MAWPTHLEVSSGKLVIFPSRSDLNVSHSPQIELVKSEEDLLTLCLKDGAIYVGSTADYADRKRKLEDKGFFGTFYYRETKNMAWAENKLLKKRPGGYEHSRQTRSTSQEAQGYACLIIGKRCRKGNLKVSLG